MRAGKTPPALNIAFTEAVRVSPYSTNFQAARRRGLVAETARWVELTRAVRLPPGVTAGGLARRQLPLWSVNFFSR